MQRHNICDRHFGKSIRFDGWNVFDLPSSDVFSMLDAQGFLYFEDAHCSLEAFTAFSDRLISKFGKDPSSYGNRELLSAGASTYEAVKGTDEVPPHGELYSLPSPPDLLFLHCSRPADVGGENTFYCGIAMADDLVSVVRKRLEVRPIVYRHRWGRPQWEHYFETPRLEEALAKIRALPRTRIIEETSEVVVFDYETSAFSRESGALVNGIVNILSRKGQGINDVFWKGGTRIEDSLLGELYRVARRHERTLNLNAGEFVIVNNHRIMHGRKAFSGQRKVAARFGARSTL